ncbi:Hypothetical protein EIN_528410, partial [Entamoeba invadens IP1]
KSKIQYVEHVDPPKQKDEKQKTEEEKKTKKDEK